MTERPSCCPLRTRKWTEHFHVIDIYGVLIESTATHIVLRREFVVCTYASLLLNQTFHPVSVGRWRHLHVLSLQLLYLVRLYFFSLDIHLIEGGGASRSTTCRVCFPRGLLSTFVFVLKPIYENLTTTLSAECSLRL